MNFKHCNYLSYENRQICSAPILSFAAFLGFQLLAVLAFIRYYFPWTWDQHLASGVLPIFFTCLACNFVICFGEYFFHRYLLHLETVNFLSYFTMSHRSHHKLTSIGFDDQTKRVRSNYEIDTVAKDEHATFPSWALVPTFAAFTPFFAPMAFSFPEIPILISGYISITIALFLYEAIHVLHHQSYETHWKPRLKNQTFGAGWRALYGFHQGHHANYRCNLNVAGFFGLPLADLVFNTYKQPKTLLVDGASATKQTARNLTPQAGRLIVWLDRVSFKRRRWMSKAN